MKEEVGLKVERYSHPRDIIAQWAFTIEDFCLLFSVKKH